MSLRFSYVCLGLMAVVAMPAQTAERERNLWPVQVAHIDGNGAVTSWQGAGPLLFRQPLDEGRTAAGFRPFYLRKQAGPADPAETSFLYPIFTYRSDSESYRWSVLQLINGAGPKFGAPTERNDAGFDVWPFYFSRKTDSPETSYRALFPIVGTLKDRLFNQRMSWLLFPLYLRTENRGVTATSYLWPIGRTLSGEGNTGFALWPLFGWRSKPGVYHREFYVWPVYYHNVTRLDQPVPSDQFGVLPFYAREHTAEARGETYLWPFFGYTHRTAPYHYDEKRYFWPLFVQGRGDDHYINRWAPFHTHSIVKGINKTWVMWPLFRRQQWEEGGLAQTRTQFFFFLYWSLAQRSATNPRLAPAQKTHVWPLYSSWDNGAGRRQLQVLSPIEVFFPHNENMRLLWSPLFALYRYDRQEKAVRQSALFDLVTWRQTEDEREFHLGPLFSTVSSAATRRIALGNGLFGLQRSAAGGWRPFWFDFSSKRADGSTPGS